MTRVDIGKIKKLWPHASSQLQSAVSSDYTDIFLEKFGFGDDLSLVHLMAQVSHETNGGTQLVENLNYSADALIRVWPYHFNHWNAGEFAHKPREIANQAYDGRDGNRPNTDDGWEYRGRGGTMVTGRANYERLGKSTGLDLAGDPDLVLRPENFMLCAAADFVDCGCMPYTRPSPLHKRGDVVMVTRRLNGGEIGLESRETWFAKWCLAYGL